MNARPRLLRAFSVAVVSVALVAALKLVFVGQLGFGAPFLLMALGVVVSAWYGGVGGAAFATLLSALAIWFLFLPPEYSFALDDHRDWGKLAAFVIEGALITAVVYLLQHAHTRERQARIEAEAAERFLSTALRSIGDGVIATDAHGRITLLNRVAEELTGWTTGEAIGRALEEVFRGLNEETREPFPSPVERVLRERKIIGLSNHTLLISRTGSETAIADSAAPIADDSGRLTGVVLVFRDVTDARRKQAQRDFLHEASIVLGSSLDYRETLSRLATLIVPRLADWAAVDLIKPETGELEQVAVWHRDPRMREVAEQLRRRYPPDPNEQAGTYAVVRSGKPLLVADVTDTMLRTAARDDDHIALLRQLEVRSAMIAPLAIAGLTFGAITLVQAESARRYDEHDLSFAVDLARRAAIAVDNARLYAAEQQARELADNANRAKDEFLATVSHELRTPLNAIMGWTDLLMRGLEESKKTRAIETIGRNATTMAQLIDDLLDVSRIISGKMRLDLKTLSAPDVVRAVIDSFRPSFEAKQVKLSSALESSVAPVLADGARLQQVVSNLLGNALKFTPRGGRVGVTVSQRQGMVEIAVSDTGKGIGPNFLPHVFDAFRQADGSMTRAHGGLGLGLAISHRLVEMHGGRLVAHSAGEGKGATFKLVLPALVAPARAGSAAQTDGAGAPVDAGLRVLVVEDDPDARELLQEVLGAAGCHVTAAAAVGDALEALEREHPDVLLSDIAMPDETGFDLIRKVRALPPEKGGNIPAAALTAYASLEDRRRVLQAGFMMHVPKPIVPDELLNVVGSLARHRPAPSSVPPR